MLIQATVVNVLNGLPLPDVALSFYNGVDFTTVSCKTDKKGKFYTLVPDSADAILFTKDNFQSLLVSIGTLEEAETIELAPVQPGCSYCTWKPNSPGPLILFGSAALALVSKGALGKIGSKKMGADFSNYILPVGLLVGGYLVAKNLGLFGNDTGANNATTAATIQAGTKTTLAQLASAGITPTLTAAAAASIANNIYTAGIHVTSSSTQGVATVFNQLLQCRNDADIILIMQNFGTRKVSFSDWNLCAILSINCDAIDLESFVTAVLNQANVPGLGVVDLNYQLHNDSYGNSTGITYTF